MALVEKGIDTNQGGEELVAHDTAPGRQELMVPAAKCEWGHAVDC